MSSEVDAVPKAKHPDHCTSRGGHLNDQTTAGRLEHVLESDSWTFSTLATIIANERSEGGFTPGARSDGEVASLTRSAMSEMMSGRHMRARTAAYGAVIVRRDRKTSYSCV